MGVKYVRDFEFPAAAGFRDSAMPAKARASERGMPAAAKKGVAKLRRGGPTTGGPQSRVPTGPTAPRYGYIPNPFGQDIRYKKGPSGVSFPKKATTNPRDIFGNENPDFNRAMREAEEARMREMRGDIQYAKGGKVGKVMREYKAGKLHSGKDGKVVKNPKQAMAIALSEARKSGEKVKKLARGGPSSREPTGPTSKRVGYFPNPFGKSIRFVKGPSGGGYQRSYKYDSPYLMDENFRTYPNPDYDPKYDRRETGPQMARGGKVAKRANGGMMSKGPSTRGTPAKGRAQGRMDFAEKYAPGLSLDMPGKRVKKK